MIIEIKPIEKERWHGYKRENDFSRPIKIFPVVDNETRKYRTGLTENEIEALKKMGVPYNLDSNYNRYEPHEFWDSPEVAVKLEKRTIRLNDEIPMDFIKYKYILEHPAVANSMDDYENGKYPDATHYITNSPAALKKKANLVELKKKAYEILSTLDRERKVQVIMLVLGKDVKKKADNEIEVLLDELITNNPKEAYEIMSRNPEKMEAEYIVKLALRKGVLQRDPTSIKFMDLKIGSYISEAADFLMMKENKELKDKIVEQIK